jgi:hypothetical protein
MTVRRSALACLAALLLGLSAALAVGCGDDADSRELIAASRASAMQDDLDRISELVEQGKCDGARDRIDSLRAKVADLPRSTNRDLRERLREGVTHLEEIAPGECSDNEPETTETTEVPETTETIPETVPETTPQETNTQPPETTPEPPPETEPPPEEEPETPVDPGDSGGEQAPGAAVPPGQAKKGDG